jgi:polar amino acid transport system substrate-binding protein
MRPLLARALCTLTRVLVVSMLFGLFVAGGWPATMLRATYGQGTTSGAPLRVAITEGLVPWTYRDKTGQLTGFEVEMLRNIGQRLNRPVDFISVQWDGIFAGLAANKYDIIASAVTVTCERQKIIDFSVPYYDTGVSITARKNDPRVRTVNDLKGMVVGVGGSGTTSHLWLLRNRFKYGIKEIKVYDAHASAMLDLEIGRLDAVAEMYPTAMGYVKDKPVLDVRLRGLTGQQTAMVFRKGDAVETAVNTAIDTMKKDGALAQLHKQQFGFDAPKDGMVNRVVPPVPPLSDCK